MKYVLPALLIAVAMFFVSRRLFLSIVFMLAQVMGNALVSRLKLGSFPLLNWDYEVSNILLITATATIGPLFALVVAGGTMLLHSVHEEVTDLHSLLDYALRSIILVAVIGLSGVELFTVIPWAILLSKLPVIILDKVLWGSYLWSVFNYKELFSVIAYFAVFNLL
jgi:hypothetical protein